VASPAPGSFSFAGVRLQADGTLFRGDTAIHLPPKELAALRLLLARAGQVVSPRELKDALWGETHVTPDSVTRCLSSLREHLGAADCIQTVYKRGYRLTAKVERPLSEAAARAPRLAIPPFTTHHGVPEHLGTAVADETIAGLSNETQFPVTVLARDSVFTLAKRGRSALEIGEALKADLVLAGTLQWLSTHFRLRAEMIRVADGAQIWVEDMLVDRTRPAAVEAELIKRLRFRLAPPGTLADTLADSESASAGEGNSKGKARRIPLTEPATALNAEDEALLRQRDAYSFFLRGRHEWQTLERHRMQDGMQKLLEAVELDSELVAAKVELVNLCVTQAVAGYMPLLAAADLARKIAHSIPDFHGVGESVPPSLGWFSYNLDRDLPAALQAFSQVEHLAQDPWTMRVRTMFLLGRHRFEEAIALMRSAIETDPYSPWLQARLAWALHLNGQVAESVEKAREVLSVFPCHEGTSLYGSMILAFNDDPARAVKLADELTQRLPQFDIANATHAYALARTGRSAEALNILERMQWLGRERYVISTFTAAVHVALGNLEAGLEELRVSAEVRCPWFFQMLADPRLAPLHQHPGFLELQAIHTNLEAGAAKSANTPF
jgi:DNA-binding winged helix-turn-helix (wHTH) protein/tetratricopeptide (TPR) repeat protein